MSGGGPMAALIPSAAGIFRRNAKKPPFWVMITDPQQTGHPHAGKRGTAIEGSATGGRTVQVRLDDGTIAYGTDYWWEPIADRPATEAEAVAIIDVSPATIPWALTHWKDSAGPILRGRFRVRADGLRARWPTDTPHPAAPSSQRVHSAFRISAQPWCRGAQ